MIDNNHRGASARSRILAALRELIGALDRRVPQVDRTGEIGIARDAQMLRRQAVARIRELARAGRHANGYDQELVEAIMTDDGGPLPESRRDTRSTGSGRKRLECASVATPTT